MELDEVKVCVLSSLELRSRDQLIQVQKEDSEFCGLYCYLENPYGIESLQATIFEKLSQFLN